MEQNNSSMIYPALFILRMRSCTYEFVRVGSTLIGRTLVTQSMWHEVMGSNPSVYQGDNMPVNNVSYNDIEEFITRLTELTSIQCGYRLSYKVLSEDEWESSAGDQMNTFADSETVINAGLSTGFRGLHIWSSENSHNQAHEVDATPPNEYGLYDMYGNVWEVCRSASPASRKPLRTDYSDELEYRRAELRRLLLENGRMRLVLKGGAWNMPKDCCVKQTRMEINAGDKFSNAGFRLSVTITNI